jgi:hypothetical protein
VPHRVFNSKEFIVFDFCECRPFPTRQLSVVLQNEANEQGCTAVRHVHNFKGFSHGSVEYNEEPYFLSQVSPNRLFDAVIEIFGVRGTSALCLNVCQPMCF